MSAEFPTLAEVIATHRWVSKSSATRYMAGCACGWERDIANTHRTGLQLHGEHVERMWREACTIRTVEQLEALPDHSAFLVIDGSDEINRRTTRRSDGSAEWWTSGSDEDVRSNPALLPALLIWHPNWSKS